MYYVIIVKKILILDVVLGLYNCKIEIFEIFLKYVCVVENIGNNNEGNIFLILICFKY